MLRAMQATSLQSRMNRVQLAIRIQLDQFMQHRQPEIAWRSGPLHADLEQRAVAAQCGVWRQSRRRSGSSELAGLMAEANDTDYVPGAWELDDEVNVRFRRYRAARVTTGSAP